MLLLVALLSFATAARCALGQGAGPGLFGCSNGKTVEQEPVCDFSAGPFHMLCSTFPLATAEQECRQYGWRLAAITEENLLFAQQLFPICSVAPRAWIASLNGLNAEPFLTFTGNTTVAEESYVWGVEYLPVLCEDTPVVTETTSSTTTVVHTSGTVCTTTTVTTTRRHRGDQDRDHWHQKAAEGCGPQCNQCIGRPTSMDCNCCSDVCPASYLGLHIVSGNRMTYADAKAACCRHGWSLADLTSGMTSVVRDELVGSCAQDSSLALWVRSYEGVAGVDCIQASFGQNTTSIVFGHDDRFCGDGVAMPQRAALCQEDPVFLTGVGPFAGATTTTTTTVVSTDCNVVPQSTRTVTKTVTCAGSRPRKPASSEDGF